MLMMCWFYCIPLAKVLFFALGPLFILLGMFVLKRGVRQSRVRLRQLAFMFFCLSFMKMLTIDIYLARDHVCQISRVLDYCTPDGFKKVQGGALLLLVIISFFLFNLYRSFAQDKPQRHITPQEAHLSFWGNLSILLVMVLILWLAAPWVGFLTVGHVPEFFMTVPWQNLVVLNVLVLLRGFWKLEDCSWTYDPTQKDRKRHQSHVWTAKDTLWVSVILLLIALLFSYASSDVLSTAMPKQGTHMGFSISDIDISKIAPQYDQAPHRDMPLH